jgi:SpoVK/Ycf46/Vps4 family AAA+-type ATPase
VNNSREELDTLLRASYPVLYVVTHEESRVEDALKEIVDNHNQTVGTNTKLWTWSATEGAFQDSEKFEDLDSPIDMLDYIGTCKQSGVFILKDFSYFLTEGAAYLCQRKLKDVATSQMNSNCTIVIVDSELEVPSRLEKIITVVDFDLPDSEEIASWTSYLLDDCAETQSLPEDFKHKLISKVSNSAVGLTLGEAENVFSKSLAQTKTLDPRIVVEEKKNIIRKSGVLQYYEVNESLKSVGGLPNLKTWLRQRGRGFSQEAKDFGLPNPKGVLIVGIQGTGKSLISKCFGSEWNMPVLRMDVGALFGSLVGQSEANMRKALKTAEACAPCILWIDELEKSMGNTSGVGDSGTSSRVFASFLTWMQDKTAPVFVVATANNVSMLPPEMLRKGRFDELFFVDLPNGVDRKEIIDIHLTKYGRNPAEFDVPGLVEVTPEFSGAELEQVVVDGLFRAFSEDGELGDDHLQSAANATVPISHTMKPQIDALREWARGKAVLANENTNGSKAPARRKRRRAVNTEIN